MDKKEPDPDDPLIIDDDGLYMTLGQMQYWLNRKGAKEEFLRSSKKFLRYYNSCRTYNLISELMDIDPDCAYMYWDEKRGVPAFSFPVNGIVTDSFRELGLIGGKFGDGIY